MKLPSYCIAGIFVAGGAALAIVRSHQSRETAQRAEIAAEIAAITNRLEAAERALDASREATKRLAGEVERLSETSRIASQGSAAAARRVPAALSGGKTDGETADGETEATGEGAADAVAKEKAPEALLDRLFDAATPRRDRPTLWQKVREAGLIDVAVQRMEERAREYPSSAEVQNELGAAYIQRLSTAGDLEKGTWAMKADGAFDKALELQPDHWEARFQKAVALSFWPPITGKQTEAVKHFEILLGQQEAAQQQPHHAQTYLFLGNLYQQQGNREKAVETWKRGAAIHPQDKDLQNRTAADQ